MLLISRRSTYWSKLKIREIEKKAKHFKYEKFLSYFSSWKIIVYKETVTIIMENKIRFSSFDCYQPRE